MKVLSLYCGAGGVDEGLKQAGIKTTLAVDCERDCVETMRLNHDCETLCAKVEDVDSTFDKFDIIVGGAPCPPFSRANHKSKKTLDPKNVNKFWEIIDRLQPKYYLMENVQDVIKVCNRKNYLINCADYGTPQLRVRRFFTNLPLPKQTHCQAVSYDLDGNLIKKWVSVEEAINFKGTVEDRKTTFGEGFRPRSSSRPCFTLLADCRVWLINDEEERKASLQEVAILQGFPKNYRFFGNSTSVKKQIGNAVPLQVIKAFFEQICLPKPIPNKL